MVNRVERAIEDSKRRRDYKYREKGRHDRKIKKKVNAED
jgi:hypothetical protein